MKRYQKGQIVKTSTAYFVRFYQTTEDGRRKQKAVRLCDAHHSKGHARKLAAPIIRQVNDGRRTFQADMKIVDFVETVFKPWYDSNGG